MYLFMKYYRRNEILQVWDEDEHGNWHLTASWKAHSGSVWKVTWAHPEFGQVLATCSFDRTAAVWEEIGTSEGFFSYFPMFPAWQ